MTRTIKLRSYTVLAQLPTFRERFQYLQLCGIVGQETFGSRRYLNQAFYLSREWKRIRDEVILRDNGCDLGLEGYEIHGPIYIHHMNPVREEDFQNEIPDLLQPEFLICTSFNTHQAIHYGDESLLVTDPIIRTPNDTCPWKH